MVKKFLDGTYYLKTKLPSKVGVLRYICKFNVSTCKTPSNGKVQFESEIGMQIYRANPDLSVASIQRLVAQQWNDLPAEQKEQYNRRAIECNLKKHGRCEGRLIFKRAGDGQAMTLDLLLDYVKHSDLLSIRSNRSRTGF